MLLVVTNQECLKLNQVTYDYELTEDVISWCKDTLAHDWHFSSMALWSELYEAAKPMILFEDATDMVVFKMRWL